MSNPADPVKGVTPGGMGNGEENPSKSLVSELEVGIGGTEAKELVALLHHISRDVSKEIDDRFKPEA